MGWSGGSNITQVVIDNFPIRVNQQDKRKFFKAFIEEMYNHDWDTDDEMLGQDEDFDFVLKELNPDWEYDE
jgi:hypothetical protein